MNPTLRFLSYLFLQIPGMICWCLGYYYLTYFQTVFFLLSIFTAVPFQLSWRDFTAPAMTIIGYGMVCFAQILRRHRKFRVSPWACLWTICQDLLLHGLVASATCLAVAFSVARHLQHPRTAGLGVAAFFLALLVILSAVFSHRYRRKLPLINSPEIRPPAPAFPYHNPSF